MRISKPNLEYSVEKINKFLLEKDHIKINWNYGMPMVRCHDVGISYRGSEWEINTFLTGMLVALKLSNDK